MGQSEWDGPPSMDGYLKYLTLRDSEPLDEATRLLERANMGDHPVCQYSAHSWREHRIKEIEGLDNARLARETGERMAKLREEGFQGTDNELLFAARRDVTRELCDVMDARIEAERRASMTPEEWRLDQIDQAQADEMVEMNPPSDPELVAFARRLAKRNHKRGRRMRR